MLLERKSRRAAIADPIAAMPKVLSGSFGKKASASNNTRYVLVRDALNLGTTPSYTDVFTTAVVASPFSSLNVVQQKRFRVLCDFIISGSAAGVAASTVRRNIAVNQPCYFTGAASTTKAAGSLYLLVVTDAATSSNHDVEMQIIYSDY